MSKDKEKDKDKADKKNTSLRLDSKTLKALKVRAIEDDMSVQSVLEYLIGEYLDNRIKIKRAKK